jgi:protoporphyrinogen oxidase
MVPDLPNMGISCLVFKLKRSVSPHFWVNVSEPTSRPVSGETVVYIPYYMPNDNIKFTWSDQMLLDEAFGYLQRINPVLGREDIIAAHVARLRYAQPVCEPGFAARIPPVQTPIKGLQIADTCFYYLEDRGISQSIRLGRQMAQRIA